MDLKEYLELENYNVVGKEVYVTCCNVTGLTSLRNVKPTKMAIQLITTKVQKDKFESLIQNPSQTELVNSLDFNSMFKFAKLKENGQIFSKNSWISYLGSSSSNMSNALKLFLTLEEAEEHYTKETELAIRKLNLSKESIEKSINETLEQIYPQSTTSV